MQALAFYVPNLILKAIQMGLASLMLVQAATTSTPVLPVSEQIKQEIVNQSLAQDLDPKLATQIAKCESQFRQFDDKTGDVLRGVHNPQDVGVFQINEKYHLERASKLGYDIYTLEGNVGYGLYLLKMEGTRHWISSKPCWSPA